MLPLNGTKMRKSNRNRPALSRKPSSKKTRRGTNVASNAETALMVSRWVSTKEALAAIPRDVLNVLLLGGHIVNELTTLNRLLVFTMRSWDDEVQNSYAAIQYVTLLRLSIGKVAEALDVFQQRFLRQRLGNGYRPLIEAYPGGRRALAHLRLLVGGTGLLRRLRNGHAFHNPSDASIANAFDSLGTHENWSMMAGSTRHSVAFPMSQAVTLRALIDETGISDPRAATEAVRDELLDAADAIISFFEHFTMVVAERHELFFGDPVPVRDTANLPLAADVRIPPLCRDRASPPRGRGTPM